MTHRLYIYYFSSKILRGAKAPSSPNVALPLSMQYLSRSCNDLSLSERERKNVDLSTNEQIQEVGLAVKLFTRKSSNIEAVARTFYPLRRTWNDVQVRDGGNNHLVFAFESIVEVEKVLLGEPWSYDRHFVAFKMMDGLTLVQEIDFSTTKFWVQIHDLPFAYMTRDVAINIGE